MAIPTSNEIIRPMLEHLAENKEPVPLAKLIQAMAERFKLTEEDRKEIVNSGGNRFRARVCTAIYNTKKSRLITAPKRGRLQITEKGREEIGDISPPVEESIGSKTSPPVEEVQEPKADTAPQGDKTAEIVGQIITAHLSRTGVDTKELPTLIKDTYDALSGTKQQPTASSPIPPAPSPSPPTSQDPAVPIKESVTDEHIICLECGKPFASMKRHLNAHHLTTPEKYRDKWGLPTDYPMVAKNTSQKRSKTAKNMGLGQMGQAAQKNQGGETT